MPLTKHEKFFLSAAIVWGVFLRLLFLDTVPYGIEMEEAGILVWGEKTIREARLLLYVPDGAEWENLPGVIFYLLRGLFGGVFRLTPTLLSLLELAVLFAFVRKLLNERSAWIATALVALCPWHFFYSRISGTSVGVGTLLMLGVLYKDHPGWKAVGRHAFGLLYYTTYRLLALRLALEYAYRRSRRGLFVLGGAGVLVIALLFFSENPISKFFLRGAHHFDNPAVKLDVPRNFFYSTFGSVLPVPSVYEASTSFFLADYVHSGFVRALGGHPPLGWGFAMLAAFAALLAVYATVRRSHRAAISAGVRRELGFLVGMLLCLGAFGPQFSRTLTLLPFLALLTVWGLDVLRAKVPARAFQVGLAMALISTGWSQWVTWRGMRDRALMEPVFHGRYRDAAEYLSAVVPNADEDTVYLLAYQGFVPAAYWGRQFRKFSVVPPQEPEAFAADLNARAAGRPQYVALLNDAPGGKEYGSSAEAWETLEGMMAQLEARSEILEDRPLRFNGEVAGRLLKVQWTYQTYANRTR